MNFPSLFRRTGSVLYHATRPEVIVFSFFAAMISLVVFNFTHDLLIHTFGWMWQ